MKNTEKASIDAGSTVLPDGNIKTAGGRPYVQRVIWRTGEIVVYRDSIGRFYWANLTTRQQYRAVIRGGRLG
jgi:hypothetical protein